MSRNYELLQGMDFLTGRARTRTAEETTVVAERIAPAPSSTLSSVEPVAREEVMKIVQRLFLIPQQNAPRAVLFAAVDANNGCNGLCAVTAKLLAESVPGSVCLVEGNFRSPSLADLLAVERDQGFVHSLQLERSIRDFTEPVGPDNLWVLTAGAALHDSSLLLNSGRLKYRIAELRKEFEYIVMNAPPLSTFADGLVLGRLVDGVVLVLEANATRREAAVRVAQSLRNTNIPVLGAVLNNRTFPIPAAVYRRI